MKKLLTLVMFVAGFVSGPLSAQDFSGTIVWTMRVDITDPAMKQQLADAQAQLADPKIQAQMEAAQEAMNNPEMREMMNANPQMKEMMEKQMKAFTKPGANGDPFPKGFTLKIKGPRSLVTTEGGFGAGEMLNWADQNVSYQLDREARTYKKIPAAEVKDAGNKFKVTPTQETANVLGYACRKSVVETTEGDSKMTYAIWATDGIKGLDARSLRRLRLGQSANSDFLSRIEGVPLKIEAATEQFKMMMEATSVKSEALPDSLFVLPPGFKEIAGQGL